METEMNGQDSIGNRTKESIAQDSGISSEPASANEVSVIKVNVFFLFKSSHKNPVFQLF